MQQEKPRLPKHTLELIFHYSDAARKAKTSKAYIKTHICTSFVKKTCRSSYYPYLLATVVEATASSTNNTRDVCMVLPSS